VCRDCIARFAAPVARCRRCGLRVAAQAAQCGACLAEPPPFDACVVAVDYAFPWDRLIADFKFNGRVELAAPLAALLVQAIGRAGDALPSLVVPVPLAPQRLAERGYNQAWLLAKGLGQALRRPATPDALVRVRSTPRLMTLDSDARLRAIHGAFRVSPAWQARLRGRHITLVDDVLTTGATLDEISRLLREHGAAGISVWVLARTPAPEPHHKEVNPAESRPPAHPFPARPGRRPCTGCRDRA
jgi:ComF family protein